MLRSGGDIFTLAKLMGHQNFVVLQRYQKKPLMTHKKHNEGPVPLKIGYLKNNRHQRGRLMPYNLATSAKIWVKYLRKPKYFYKFSAKTET